MVKGPRSAGSAGVLGCHRGPAQPHPESIPSSPTTPSTGAQPCSPFHTHTGHPVLTTPPLPLTHLTAPAVRQPKPLTAGQGPGQSHDEVSKVVGMADHTPPPRHQQPSPCGCRDGLKVWGKTRSGMGDPLEVQLPDLASWHPRNPAHQPLWDQKDSSGRCFSENWLHGRCSNQQLGESVSRQSGAFCLTLTNYPQPRLILPGDPGPSPWL